MRKIRKELENPVDNVLIDVCEKVAPVFHATGHYPNHVTSYSFLFGLMATRSLWLGEREKFAAYLIISYFFDCLDGFLARSYCQETRFGDMYDHIKDNTIVLGIVVTLYFRLKSTGSTKFYGIVTTLAILMVAMAVHMGCQQKQYPDSSGKELLDNLKCLCLNQDDIKLSRFFGAGTFYTGLIALIYFTM
jgi:phosphatidylglycerophosphate synthase